VFHRNWIEKERQETKTKKKKKKKKKVACQINKKKEGPTQNLI